jgi:hypothetical protein
LKGQAGLTCVVNRGCYVATAALAMDTIMGQSDEDEDNLSALLISVQVLADKLNVVSRAHRWIFLSLVGGLNISLFVVTFLAYSTFSPK